MMFGILSWKNLGFIAFGAIFCVSVIRAAHRSGEYNFVEWIIGQPIHAE